MLAVVPSTSGAGFKFKKCLISITNDKTINNNEL